MLPNYLLIVTFYYYHLVFLHLYVLRFVLCILYFIKLLSLLISSISTLHVRLTCAIKYFTLTYLLTYLLTYSGAHLPVLARIWIYHGVSDAWPMRQQTTGYLPNQTASPLPSFPLQFPSFVFFLLLPFHFSVFLSFTLYLFLSLLRWLEKENGTG